MKRFLLIFLMTIVVSIGALAQSRNFNLSTPFEDLSKEAASNQSSGFDVVTRQIRPFTVNSFVQKSDYLEIGDTLTLNLFKDKVYPSTIISKTIDVNGVVSIITHLTEYHYSYCYISMRDDILLITIEIPERNEFYLTRYHASNRGLYLIQIDETQKDELEGGPSLIPEPDQEKFRDKKGESDPFYGDRNSTPCLGSSDFARINILIVYTPAARVWAIAPTRDIDLVISDAISHCNNASANNNLGIHFNLAHSAEVAYIEENANTDLTKLQNGVIPNVHALRNTYAADLVVLFSLEHLTGGLGYLLDRKAGFEEYGFSLTRVQQASGSSFTTIHEIGHNMGAHHHKSQNVQPGPTTFYDWSENTWSAGWRWTSASNEKFCDLMTYDSGTYFADGITHIRVPYFSDPLTSYQSVPTGDAVNGDNARTLRETKHVISQYRDSTTLQFCTAQSANANYRISNVQLGNRTQSAGTKSYYDFSNCAVDVNIGTPVQLTISITNPFYSQQLLAWVDWNDNKLFDSGEQVYASSTGAVSQYVFNIIPSIGTPLGLKRLRIRLHLTSDGPNATPCGSSSHGQVQDFTLNVLPPLCEPIAITSDPINQNMSSINGANLSVGVSGTPPFSYQWQFYNGASWLNVLDNIPLGSTYTGSTSSTLGVFSITNPDSYAYRSVVTNCSGLNSDSSNSAFVIVTLSSAPASFPIVGNDHPCQNSAQWYQLPSDPSATSATFYNWTFPSDWTILNPIQIVAGWNFENTAKRGAITNNATFISTPYKADSGMVANINISPLALQGGAEYSGWLSVSPGYAPNSNKWDSGMGLKYWQITCSTLGYDYLTLSSKQRSSNTGPKNFKIQYSLDALTWNDIAGSLITVAANFTLGVLNNIQLPKTCANQDLLYLRWVMTSNISVNGGTVGSTGTNSIDDIYLFGKNMAHDSVNVLVGTQNGNIEVIPMNSYGVGALQTMAVTTITVPAQTSVITGNITPCQGATGLAYSVTNITGVTYTWSVPMGWTISSGQNTNSITVTAGTTAGNITVTPSNSCGSGTARNLAVTTITVPEQPSLISGNNNPCQGATGLAYSVTNITGVTYTWSVPTGWTITSGQNTNSITVTAGLLAGNITVIPSNTCGNGTVRTKAVTTTTVPAQPSSITGNLTPCQGATGLAYSVTNITGVTYTWSVPMGWTISSGQNTNSITVTAGTTAGNITVTPSNSCGSGTARNLAVTTITVPEQPSLISGNNNPCQGATGLAYSVTNITGVTYTWSVPMGWTISSGQNTNSITVTAGTTSGNITVIPSNTCGNGISRTLAVTTATVPAQPSNITGNTSPCQGASGVYAINGVAIESYNWQVPTGWTISNGQGTDSITVIAGSLAGNITVTPSNTCGNGIAGTFAVTTATVPAQPSNITGNTSPCQGASGVYAINGVAIESYNWQVPTGWIITSGQGTDSITVTAGTTAGNITVIPSNTCGNGISRTLAVTTASVPAQPANITGNTSPCQGASGVYAINGVAIESYNWQVPTGWIITSGQGTNSITVIAGSLAGNITVTPSNTCGNGTALTLAVITATVPAQPSNITGNTSPCQGASGVYAINGVAIESYNWQVPTGWIITSGQGTDSITVIAGSTAGNITVIPSNSCGNGIAQTLAVTSNTLPAQPANITGNISPCQGASGVYAINGVAIESYNWQVPTGWIITSGQGSDSITVTAGTTSGNITVIPSNSCGNGIAQTLAVTSNTLPAQPANITGNISPCQGASGVYAINGVAIESYNWQVPTGWIITSGQGSDSITVTAGTTSGNITVIPSNTCGNGISRTLAVTTLGIISQPSEIVGNISPCQGTTGQNYSVTNIAGVSYNWTVPTGWTISNGQGTNSITVTAGTTAGNITVTPSNSCGNGTAQTLAVTSNTLPAQPANITGNITPCQGASGVYAINGVAIESYNWQVPTGWIITSGQGSDSITVTAGTTSGNITVIPSNTCGNGISRTLAVTTLGIISQPSEIVGNISPCQGTTGQNYSVTNIAGVSYNWTVPTGWTISNGQGTNSITVTAGTTAGNITVTPSNSCGNGIAQTLAVTTSSVPAQPSVIGGNISPCQGTTGIVYSVTNIAGVTYNWTVPAGWTITSGQNTNLITVTAGTTSGNITVTPSNTCGNGIARTFAVTTATVPAQPANITGNTSPCQGASGVYAINGVAIESYNWQVPTGWTITSGQNTNLITVTAGTTSGNITVTPSNTCGNGIARTFAVTTATVPAQPANITGNTSPCQGASGVYAINGVAIESYNWQVPTGWIITSGQGTNSITVIAGTTSGNITVTPSNSCGNGIAQTLAVTTATVPAQPSNISGNNNPCQGATGLAYSVTNITGATYTWSVPTGWTITSGQNTNSITVTAGTTAGSITVTPSNTCGNGTVRSMVVTTITVPVQSSLISGNNNPCQGATGLAYSVTNIAGATYTWSVPTGWAISNGQGTNSITVTAGSLAGNITVIPSNTCGNGISRTLAVTTLGIISQPSEIVGNISPCQGTTGQNYSVTNIAGVSYNWTVPTGWTISNGQGTNSITLTAGSLAGNITVIPSNTCGNGTARTLAVTTTTVPAQPSSITGNTSPCQGASGIYAINGVAIESYNWQVPTGWIITSGQGTDSITVTAGTTGGSITVTPSNSCGNGIARSLAVTTLGTISQPSEIVGNISPCQGTTGLAYSVTNITGVTYTWSVPTGWSISSGQNTNSITVTAGTTSGNITVTPSNTCGNGIAQTFAVTTATVPAQPANITGNTSPCQGASGVYAINGVAIESYNWQVPTGWIITSGQGTDSITVIAGSTAGNITVIPSNTCGNGTARSMAVTTTTIPEQPSVITGNITPCQSTTGIVYSVTNITGVTYTWSVPMGWTISSGQNTNSITVTAGSTAGNITVIPSNTCGNGTARTLSVTTITVPAQSSLISGNNNPCQGATGIIYSVTNITGVTYTWSVPMGWTISSGQNTNSITVTAGTIAGDISVTPSNTCGNGTARTLAVTTTSVPAQPAIISGNTSPCQGASGVYAINGVAIESYNWQVPTGWIITSGQNTNSITVTAGTIAGDISVTPSNTCGNGTARTLAVTIATVPAQPANITGNTSPCQGASGVYAINGVAIESYNWQVPTGWIITSGQNTNSITVTAGTIAGNITVTPSNSCGNGTAQTLAVTSNTLPAQPANITGNTSPCQGASGVYAINGVDSESYNWQVPTGWIITSGQNTNSITVTAGTTAGNITVTPSNSCGNGIARTLAVTTTTVPAQPANIIGNMSPCQGASGIYAINGVDSESYNWQVPTGWIITSGQGTDSITVTAGTTSGNITVTPSNSCGNGIAQTLAVTTTAVPAQPANITGNMSPCQGASGVYAINGVASESYNWQVPTGWTITSGQSTNSITVTAGTTAGNITVIPSNTCGNGIAQTLAVTTATVPAQPAAITGNTSPCQGASGIYAINGVAIESYNWQVPTGWIITSGQGTDSITVIAGSTAGNITVIPSNSCGNGIVQTLAVTTATVPAQPAAITGNTSPCQGASGVYAINGVAIESYNWQVPTGWIITSGQGTDSITVIAGSTSGNITVIPSNTCGNGIAQTLSVTTATVPAQPANITGNTSPCQGASGVYAINGVAIESYNWQVPTGWIITSGQGTDSITVIAGSTAGNITVIPSNTCGNGTARSMAVTTTTIPEQPSVITGNITPCQSTTGIVYSVTNITGVTYTWSVPMGWTISSGQNTNSITVTAGSTAGNITVIPSNTCGNGTARTLSVTTITVPAQSSLISGNNNPCQGATGIIYSVTNITGVTYTWSVPMGWTISSGQNTNSITVTAGSLAGNITVIPSNTCGNGIAQTLSVTTASVPAQPANITGNTSPCQGASGIYAINGVAIESYNWQVPTGWIITSGQGTDSITVTAGTTSGNITVIPSNTCGNGIARTLAVTSNTLPAQPANIIGNMSPCQGASGIYAINGVAIESYNWQVPTGWTITSGQNTNSITVTAGSTAGNITVTPSNTCGNGTARTLAVTTITVPEQPSVITGNITPCQGATEIYAINGVAIESYNWQVPTGWIITSGQGTDSITVTAGTTGGSITVTPSNSCGNGIARSLAVTTTAVPAQPANITGNISPCQGATEIYAINGVAIESYNWQVPTGWIITSGQGTDSITVTAGTTGGSITVTPSNSCGNGIAQTLAVTTATVPAQPANIIGNITPCQGASGIYAINGVAIESYNWQVPTGWIITSGQGTDSITVAAGTTSGNITVTPSNSCGNGIARTLAVTSTTVPAQPANITGNTSPCQGATEIYAINGVASESYNWQEPTGWIITSGQGTTSITVTAGTIAGDISVTPSNTCGNGTARTLSVTTITVPAQPSNIIGNTSPCQGASGVYAINGVANEIYTWSVPSGWSISSGQGTDSITVTAGTTSGNITVTPSNTCGNGISRTLAVTTATVPAQPSNIIGNTSPCQGASGVYAINGVANEIYTWSVPSGWSISSGQGTDSITVTAGTTSGNITVTPSNTCGNGTARTLAVTTITVPNTPVIYYNGNYLSSSELFGNQWYLNNQPIINATEQTHIPTQNGSYFTMITLDGCSSDTSNVIIVGNVSVKDNDINNLIEVYPNPFSDEIQLKTAIVGDINFQILNTQGQILMQERFNQHKTLNLNHLAKGFYMIKFQLNGSIVIEKIVKQ